MFKGLKNWWDNQGIHEKILLIALLLIGLTIILYNLIF